MSKCACDQCNDRVSDDGELCAFCAGRCFPTVNGRVTVASQAHRVEQHRMKAQAAQAAAQPTAPSPIAQALQTAGKAFMAEAKKELIPNLVKLAEREVKKKIGL